MPNSMIRKRPIYFILIVIIIIIGLSTRLYPNLYPPFFAKYSGDALWTATAYLVVCFISPSVKIRNAIFIALAFSYLIEISQLYHAPWIDAIRANRFAALILGFGFLWSDFVCYTIGAIFAALIDFAIKRSCLQKNVNDMR